MLLKNLTNKTLGILGGGQLGKMIAIEASRLGIKTCIFDPNKNAPAFQNANIIINDDYTNKKALRQFAKYSDKITFEFENIPLSAIDIITNYSVVSPNRKALQIGQNRSWNSRFWPATLVKNDGKCYFLKVVYF